MKLENSESMGGVGLFRTSMSSSTSDCNLAADGTVVKMKGLPFKATELEIKEFFRTHKLYDIPEEGVYMKKHADGRPNGEAFVVFESQTSAESARCLDKKQFNEPKYGDRFVRVYPMLAADMPELQRSMSLKASSTSSQSEWGANAAAAGGSSSQHQHDSVVRVKSLPFDANQADLLEFFGKYHIKPNGVQLVVRLDGRPTGEAFVDFESYEEALKASKEKDRQVFHPKFGERYVRLILVTRQEMQRVLAERYAGEGILKLKGLPFQCTFGEVRGFFAGYHIRMSGINFVMHPDGRPTGMAFVEFESVHEAIRAMEKDKARFGPEYGDRFVMLSQSSRADMDKQILKNESEEASALITGAHAATPEVGGGLGNLSWLLPPLLMAGAAGNGLNGLSGLQAGANGAGLQNLQQMFGALNMGNPGSLNLGNSGLLPTPQPTPFNALNQVSNGGNMPIPGSQVSLQDLGAAWLQQNMDPGLTNLLQSINGGAPINGQDNLNAINSNSNGNSGESGSWGSSAHAGMLQHSSRQANQSSSEFAIRNQDPDSGGSRRSSFESFANGQAYSNGNGSGNSNANGENNLLQFTHTPSQNDIVNNAFCNAVNGTDQAVNGNAFLMNQAAQQSFGDQSNNAANNAFVMNQVAQQSSFYTGGTQQQQQQTTWGGLSLS